MLHFSCSDKYYLTQHKRLEQQAEPNANDGAKRKKKSEASQQSTIAAENLN